MLNKLLSFIRQHEMVSPDDKVICAVSGGADSVALLYAMYLLAPKLGFTLEAAHFNHCLRGEESDGDAEFVRQLCDRLFIPLHMGQGKVVAGKKGLEAAARDARYTFLNGLSGKIATAHTADDNAETVLMHLVRGTGLKGLGGISPIRGNLIRPMLTISRQEVLAFLQDQNLTWREDSSNAGDSFFRNRVRHHLMPLLKEENPSVVESISNMALRLREDEAVLSAQIPTDDCPITALRQQPYAVRFRWIRNFLAKHGLQEAEMAHIEQVDRLVFSKKPSAKIRLNGGLVISRCYDQLQVSAVSQDAQERILEIPASVIMPEQNAVLHLSVAYASNTSGDVSMVKSVGNIVLRGRKSGDSMRLSGGSKSLKKLFIDRKIPANLRNSIPVLADDNGVLWVMGFGPNLDRITTDLPALEIRQEKKEKKD